MGSRLEAGSSAVRKRIENHIFADEEGEEYGSSNFGDFGDYFRRKRIKLQNLDAEIRSQTPGNPPIFRGVVVYVNGYTQPSLNDLHHMIVSHGGGFLQYLDGKTAATHIIASSLTPKKREEFQKYRIVKPSWVVESVKAGRLLHWDEFRVLDEGSSQRVLKFGADGRVTSEGNNKQLGYREQSDGSWYTSQIADYHTENHTDTTRHDLQLCLTKEEDTQRIPTDDAEELAAERQAGEQESKLSLASAIEHENVEVGHVLNTEHHNQVPGVITKQEQPKVEPPVEEKVQGQQSPIAQVTTSISPEEYNAMLLSDPRMRNSSGVNPEFIEQFYRESRLHHLATWKAELKAKLQGEAQERAATRRAQRKYVPGSRRYIVHVDFDSFFAAVSMQKHPELAGQPLGVAHGTGPGSEIASCNYAARAFGVKNGMWMKAALQMCPKLKVVPYDFPAYEEASRRFYVAVLAIDGIVQSVSIDEALVDITGVCVEAGGSDGKAIAEGTIWREQAKADEVALSLRDSVKQLTGCDVSVGIGGNILQAKVALKKAKPAGQYQLKPESVLDFIGNLPVQDLPGVAYSLGAKLEELRVKFVKDIRDLSRERLTSHLGPKTGAKLWDHSRGIDNSEVGIHVLRKSVSAEISWGIRFVTQEQAEEFVQSLCDELRRRLLENAVKGKQLTMRIMKRATDAPLEPVKHLGHGKCDTFNKSSLLGFATNSSEIIGKEAISTLRSFKFSPGDLRGLGVQMTKLEPVKPSSTGSEVPNSQRLLNFKSSLSPTSKLVDTRDVDDVESPCKPIAWTPRSPGFTHAAPRLNNESQKPLNITGTQFILPAQVDPKVVAELPGDIRSKFVSQPKLRKTSPPDHQSPTPPPRSISFPASELPPQSQLDLETLNALPDDLRAEIMAYYQQPTGSVENTLSRQPTTSSKLRTSPLPNKMRLSRGRASRPAAARSTRNAKMTLTQSNFIIPKAATANTAIPATVVSEVSAAGPADESSNEEVSAEFLAALPEDIRREVLEEQRRSRMEKQAGLNLPHTRKAGSSSKSASSALQPEQKVLQLAPHPAKPTFTSRKLSTLPELREALAEWYNSFETEGPYGEDVEALSKYLRRVICEEKDISKAVDVTRWLGWLVTESQVRENVSSPSPGDRNSADAEAAVKPQLDHFVSDAWRNALTHVRENVNAAVKRRGLPPVEFG